VRGTATFLARADSDLAGGSVRVLGQRPVHLHHDRMTFRIMPGVDGGRPERRVMVVMMGTTTLLPSTVPTVYSAPEQ